MDKVVEFEKILGETPLEAITRFRAKEQIPEQIKIAYAGRLDPMAEGTLLLLVGEACKRRDEYQAMSKTYDFEMLLGVATDSFDLLGMITDSKPLQNPIPKQKLEEVFLDLKGKRMQNYPPYSSYHVDGKPLWWWAKNNKLDLIEIPEKEVEIFDSKLKEIKIIDARLIENEIYRRIKLVNGDFRQEQILEKWNLYFKQLEADKVTIVGGSVSVSSGTYVRAFTNYFKDNLDIPVTTFSIKRSGIGNF